MKSVRHSGVDLFRPLLALLVVLSHVQTALVQWPMLERWSIDFRYTAVPAFVLMSFFLSGRKLIDGKITFIWLKKRFWRLYAPLLFWSGVAFILHPEGFSLMNVISQVAFGYIVNPALWFFPALWYITVVVYLICRYVKKAVTKYLVLVSIAFTCYIYQYLLVGYDVIKELPRAIANPLGRIPELFPFAVIGLLMADLYPNLNKYIVDSSRFNRYFALSVCIVGFWFSHVYLWPRHPSGFNYQGLGVLLSTVSLCIPFLITTRIKSRLLQKIIQIFTPVTLGIFCSHLLLREFFYAVLNRMLLFQLYPILFVVLIFFVSAFLCLACRRILPKKLDVLFA